MQEPRRGISEEEIAAIADEDARHNYQVLLRFRDRLLAAETLEGLYMALFKGAVDIPPLFIEQLTHVILRNVLDGCEDPLQLRAAELFFREQKATIRDGHALLADLETVEMHASGSRYGSLGRLLVEAQSPLGAAELDVLDRGNASLYWERESRHDTVISVTYGRAGLDAFGRVMESWVRHFLDLEVSIKPIRRIEEARWGWHVGLDAESSAILNELWQGGEIDAGRMRRVLALFSLRFEDPSAMRSDLAGRTVYLALSSNEEDVVRVKPQNLLLNLPIHSPPHEA
jgi:uncharacterized protein DUF6352